MIDISEGIKLYNNCDFFSAHDFFEDIWMDAEKSEKEFFQGLVQISVGCYHLICGNLKGAVSQLTKGKTKLRKYTPEFYKIDLSSLDNKLSNLLNKINCNKNFYNEIPTIEFIK